MFDDYCFIGVLLAAFVIMLVFSVTSIEREERRAQERKIRHAEFDRLKREKLYDPDDYWELK